jgi:cytochrome c551/c552
MARPAVRNLKEARVMANRIGTGQQSPSRSPVRLLVSVLLLGTLLAWWGTRDDRLLFGDSPRKPVAADGVALPRATQAENVLLDRGFRLSQRQCAGCHETAARSSAPSYQEIVTFYRRELPASPGSLVMRSLASAVTHPRPGWGNFAPGPPESELSLEDRVALASWILHSLDRDSNAGDGVGQ